MFPNFPLDSYLFTNFHKFRDNEPGIAPLFKQEKKTIKPASEGRFLFGLLSLFTPLIHYLGFL